MVTSVLDRSLFSEAEAARLLSVPPGTLHYWLEGGVRRGVTYRPVLRREPKGAGADVTWAEFVEAGLLRSYRRTLQVPMRQLRSFIDVLRHEFDVPYPLADRRPYAAGQRLVLEAQKRVELAPEFWLVADVQGQLSFLPAAAEFWRRVEWGDDDTPVRWRAAGPESPVVVDPARRFGRPSVKGISTEVIWEHHEAGESYAEIAADYELDVADIRWAMSFEDARRAGRAA